jgi:hypothetical protein
LHTLAPPRTYTRDHEYRSRDQHTHTLAHTTGYIWGLADIPTIHDPSRAKVLAATAVFGLWGEIQIQSGVYAISQPLVTRTSETRAKSSTVAMCECTGHLILLRHPQRSPLLSISPSGVWCASD